jgi:hypothetical protein
VRPNPVVGWKLLRFVLGADIGVVGCWARKLGCWFEVVNNKRYNFIEKFRINESRFVSWVCSSSSAVHSSTTNPLLNRAAGDSRNLRINPECPLSSVFVTPCGCLSKRSTDMTFPSGQLLPISISYPPLDCEKSKNLFLAVRPCVPSYDLHSLPPG